MVLNINIAGEDEIDESIYIDHTKHYDNEYFKFSIPDGLDKKGNWIFIKDFIPVSMPIKPFSIYYGLPSPRKTTDWGKVSVEWMFEIQTEYGSCKIREHEYSIITPDHMQEYISATRNGDAELIFYGQDTNSLIHKNMKDAIFYLQSRGISYSDALLMCVGLVDKQNIFRIEFRDEYLYHFFYSDEVDRFLDKKKNYTHIPDSYSEAVIKTPRKTEKSRALEKLDKIIGEYNRMDNNE